MLVSKDLKIKFKIHILFPKTPKTLKCLKKIRKISKN